VRKVTVQALYRLLPYSILLMLFWVGGMRPAFGQAPNLRLSVEAGPLFGRVWKHRDKFAPEVQRNAYSFEVNLLRQPTGQTLWEQHLKNPEVGLAFVYSYYGNPEELGSGYGVYPNIAFALLRQPKTLLYFRAGTGLAFLDRPYHVLDNPTNNVIGSKLNNLTVFRVGADWRLTDQLKIFTAATYLHYSNGHWQNPNLGINVPSLAAGVKYLFHPPKNPLPSLPTDSLPTDARKFHFHVRMGLAFNEHAGPGGPKFPLYNAALYASMHTSAINRLFAGVDYSFNTGVYDFIVFQEISEEAFEASNIGLFFGDEMLIGSVGISGQVGGYVYYPYLKPAPIYAKLGMVYYQPLSADNRQQLMLGLYLKSHFAIADYIDMVVGYCF